MRAMKVFSMRALAGALLCSMVLFCGSGLAAQSSTVTPRITADVDESSLATLHGNVPGLARAVYDQGEASSATRLTNVRLVLSRTSAQKAALEKYLAQLQDKSSPNYHKWLTPNEFGKLYGPADADIAVLVAWLQSQGLTLETVSKGRTNIAFSGSVSQVERAFHVSIHSFSVNGIQFYSNTTDPRIPSALAPVVMGIAHLNTIQPKPQFVRGGAGRFNPQTKRLEPMNFASANRPKPNFTLGSGTTNDPYILWIVPADAATIYDTPNSFNANFKSGGTSYTGAGVTIGIGGESVIDPTIVQNGYRSTFLGSTYAIAPTLNYCPTSSSCTNTAGTDYIASAADEAYLDTEVSGGFAPGATITYYASTDLITGIEAAIDANVVDIFSLSFGACELNLSTADNEMINGWWQQAAAQGIAVTVSTGDSGSAVCDDAGSSAADGGLAVSGWASTPYNIAVGGTDFYPLLKSFSTYVETTSHDSPSTYFRTALKYIPESTWNDSTYIDTTISQNEPLSAAGISDEDSITAGSGGVSNCSTNTTIDTDTAYSVGNCTSGYSKPSWQTGAGVPADGARDLPDVSLMAGNGLDNGVSLFCTDDSTYDSDYDVVPTDCETQSDGSMYFTGFGGTSVSAPSFAGILALVQQGTGGSRLGQAAQTLYALYNSNPASAAFNDVTVGNNSVLCTNGTPNCVANSLGYYYESGYDTTAGYDLATGLGSVDATKLIANWSAAASLAAPAVAMTAPTPNPVTVLDSFSISVSVTGSGATPTGTVTLTNGSYTSTQTLGSSGCTASDCTFTIPAGSLAIGTYTPTANYSGDSNYAAATNSTTMTVIGMPATVTASAASSINSVQPLTVTGTVIGASGTPTGTVTLTSNGYTSAPAALTNGSYSITIPANTFSATGSVTLTATYSGDSTYAAGAAGTAIVQMTYIVIVTPKVTVNAAGSVDTSQTLTVTGTVSGSSIGESSPTGTVTLVGGGYTSAPATLTTNGSYSITIPANIFSATGSATLTATYSGDLYYTSAQGTASVTVTQSVFALQVTDIPTMASSGSATATVTVSTATAYTGTVTLACTLTTYPTGATHLPGCSFMNGSTVTLSSSAASGTATATVSLASTTSALAYPKLPGKGTGWKGVGGGAVLAFLIFFGIPARRRSWRSMLGVLVLMAMLGSLAACGGSSKTGITAGTYTFTVTGTGNPAVTPVPSPVTFTAIVN